ncbi:COG2426 family protein [Clostridium hydrogeniformans]|uniref:COG2426 family protein n=1 Tax=Clostridium hydrogeniformans TaxID=349933 RepID=UPI000ADE60E0|nr:small multi-drug export protein [Clostridium hydrogeniformans]
MISALLNNATFMVFILSAIPVMEQRLAIPLGIIKYNMDPIYTMLVSFAGSLLPVPFILLLFNVIFKWMKKISFLRPLNNFIENKIQKNTGKIEKYKEIGLILFVAIPLPTTGLWTGSAVASFLGLDFKKSFICTALGGIISAIIITVVSVIFPSLLGY